MIYRTCKVPALGAAQAARTRAVPLCRFATFPPPRGGIVPNTPGPSFSSGRKGCKRPFKRDFVPLKDSPVGEPSGRPARGPSPFVATRHFPRTAGEMSPPPRPGSLVVTAGVVRARRPFLPGGSLRSQRYIRFAPRVRVSAGWYALTVPGAAQRCGTSFQRLVCGDPPVRKCLRISERVRAYGAHKGPRGARPSQGSTAVSIWPSGHSVGTSLPS